MIACVAFDYGSTLSSATAVIDPQLGMRPVDPAVIPALRLLHHKGIRLLIASNTRPDLSRRIALQHAGIEDLFSAVLNSHELGVAKPDSAFYVEVLRIAGCPSERVLFVGNNMSHDICGPLRHGMRAVLVRPTERMAGETLPDGAHMIGHVADLPGVVELCD